MSSSDAWSVKRRRSRSVSYRLQRAHYNGLELSGWGELRLYIHDTTLEGHRAAKRICEEDHPNVAFRIVRTTTTEDVVE